MQTNQLTSRPPGHWDLLPREIKQHILENLPIVMTIIFMRTAKSFRACVDDAFLERRFQNLTKDDMCELRKFFFTKGMLDIFKKITRLKAYKIVLAAVVTEFQSRFWEIPQGNKAMDLVTRIRGLKELLTFWNKFIYYSIVDVDNPIKAVLLANPPAMVELANLLFLKIQGYRQALNQKNPFLYSGVPSVCLMNFTEETPPNPLHVGTAQAVFCEEQAVIDGIIMVENLAEVEENLEAQFVAGKLCLENEEYAKAQRWFEKAARNNDAEAQYLRGVAGQKNKEAPELSAPWFLKAAEQGHPSAQYELAQLVGDKTKAALWLKRAADNDHPLAQLQYAKSVKNQAEAAQYYFYAASQGNSEAQKALGGLYQTGVGVTCDFIQAIKWYERYLESHDVNWLKCEVAGLYLKIGNRAEAKRWYIEAGERNILD